MRQVVVLFLVAAMLNLANGQGIGEVFSVMAGYPVTYSSINANHNNIIWRLDARGSNAWGAESIDLRQWIQVTSTTP